MAPTSVLVRSLQGETLLGPETLEDMFDLTRRLLSDRPDQDVILIDGERVLGDDHVLPGGELSLTAAFKLCERPYKSLTEQEVNRYKKVLRFRFVEQGKVVPVRERFSRMPVAARDYWDIALAAATCEAASVRYASKWLQADDEFILAAMEQNYEVIYSSKRARNKAFTSKVAERKAAKMTTAWPEWRSHPEFVQASLEGADLEEALCRVLQSRTFIADAIKHSGEMADHASFPIFVYYGGIVSNVVCTFPFSYSILAVATYYFVRSGASWCESLPADSEVSWFAALLICSLVTLVVVVVGFWLLVCAIQTPLFVLVYFLSPEPMRGVNSMPWRQSRDHLGVFLPLLIVDYILNVSWLLALWMVWSLWAKLRAQASQRCSKRNSSIDLEFGARPEEIGRLTNDEEDTKDAKFT